ncbi:fibronectin type III domain-containing protein [Paenisporosarcina indica]|uniref:fibronectin type III domain-containing protein n=1 Tax=Paenisporosarcina indica TaxID=650093 RepID=UPI0009501AE5|nr:fibronectin type III domain-containing protein [Paenisporosarcina indica]
MKKTLGTIFTVFLSLIFLTATTSYAANLEYVYDASNKLIEIKENDEIAVRFEYDLNGNLLSQNVQSLKAPQNLKAIFVNDKTSKISWDKVTGATTYDVHVNNDASFSTNENSAIISLSPTTTTYDVKIKAKNSFTQSEFGEILSFKAAPAPPTDLAVSNIQETAITLSWSASAGAQEYQVYYAHPNGIVPLNAGKTAETKFTINDLNHGTGYKFLVVAISGNLKSSFSEPIMSYTAMTAPFLDNSEPNDSLEQASLIKPNIRYDSYISSETDIDYYKIEPIGLNNSLFVQINATNRNYVLEVIQSGVSRWTTKSNQNGITLPVTSSVSFKVKGDFSYSTKESYNLTYTLQNTTTVCPPRMICKPPIDPPVAASIMMKSLDLHEELYDINIVTDIYSSDYDKRLLAYHFISGTGTPEDIDALEQIKENSTLTEDRDIIDWTIAKIAYTHYNEQPNTVLRYLDSLVLVENSEIQAWLMPVLQELFGDESAVQAYLDSFLTPATENAEEIVVPGNN